MKKRKLLASVLSVCLLMSFSVVNASAYSGNFRLYQHKGAPTSDNKYDNHINGIIEYDSTTVKITSATLPRGTSVFVDTSTGLANRLTRRGQSVSITNDPKDIGNSGWAFVSLDTGDTSETVKASGTLRM